MHDDKIKINLQIADQNYPLWITRSEEEAVRKAAKRVNMKLNQYRERFPSVGSERLLVMVAYDFSRENLELENRNDTMPYTEKVKQLSEELEDYLRKK
jgi:Uncharacterized protein conserved in bacteria